jgi:parvulin-like peptidyl-prolyl isomerase
VLTPTLPDLHALIGAQGLDLLREHRLLETLIERMLISSLIAEVELDAAVPSDTDERPLRLAKLARDQFGAKAEARFLQQKGRLDRVVYSLLRLDSRSQAQELYLQIAHGEADFPQLASRFSQGPERSTNGVVGPVPLNQAHPTLSDKLRAAQPGALLEPFRIDRWWVVARLERYAAASFDARMAEQMSMELLQEWLQQETAHRLSALDRTAGDASKP